MYIITDFSLEKYIEAAGETLDDLTESFKQKLYDELGISSYMRDDQCNISSEDFTPHYKVYLVVTHTIILLTDHSMIIRTLVSAKLSFLFLRKVIYSVCVTTRYTLT
jgi:hypothetical protein